MLTPCVTGSVAWPTVVVEDSFCGIWEAFCTIFFFERFAARYLQLLGAPPELLISRSCNSAMGLGFLLSSFAPQILVQFCRVVKKEGEDGAFLCLPCAPSETVCLH